MSAEIAKGALAAARGKASLRICNPPWTVKCDGLAIYRSQTARDLACLLDVNPSVVSWMCMPKAIEVTDVLHVADFLVCDDNGASWLFDAPDRRPELSRQAIQDAAATLGYRYRLLLPEEIYTGFRLQNAKDLLRYGGHQASLGDRVRLLGALDELGALPFGDCLKAIQETKPVAALASLILDGFVEVDLDEGPIGPETMVRRIRR